MAEQSRGETRRWLAKWERLLDGHVDRLLDVLVLGSQAILASHDADALPSTVTSRSIDVNARRPGRMADIVAAMRSLVEDQPWG